MAFAMNIGARSGITATYHRVSKVLVDLIAGTTGVEVAGYLSKEVRKAQDGEPIAGMTKYYTFEGVPKGDDAIAWAYRSLKETDDWKDATEA